MNIKVESTVILEVSFFLFISADSCHKKMLLESLNIPLTKTMPSFATAWQQLNASISVRWRLYRTKCQYLGLTLVLQSRGCNSPQTVFTPVLKNTQQIGKITPRTCKFTLSPHFRKKKNEPTLKSSLDISNRTGFQDYNPTMISFFVKNIT